MLTLNNEEVHDKFHEMSMSDDYGEKLYGKILNRHLWPNIGSVFRG